ncbi:MAG: hypothetical protein KatS3mg114_0360 [Planctomycetaceae bacterium]|nr:MAG: hypothetical protein KatS3mg114_0360 [Planctomycetaceae bacterium]
MKPWYVIAAGIVFGWGYGGSHPAWSKCPCQRGFRGASEWGVTVGAPLVPIPLAPESPQAPSAPAPHALQPWSSPAPMGPTVPPALSPPPEEGPGWVPHAGVAPPPGTLGRTYRQRSRLLDDDKHPRMAAVEIPLPENVDVTARGLKSVWTGKLWRLETDSPLLPGLPHVYAVKAVWKSPSGDVLREEYRWVRLIMGRVVELPWEEVPVVDLEPSQRP